MYMVEINAISLSFLEHSNEETPLGENIIA